MAPEDSSPGAGWRGSARPCFGRQPACQLGQGPAPGLVAGLDHLAPRLEVGAAEAAGVGPDHQVGLLGLQLDQGPAHDFERLQDHLVQAGAGVVARRGADIHRDHEIGPQLARLLHRQGADQAPSTSSWPFTMAGTNTPGMAQEARTASPASPLFRASTSPLTSWVVTAQKGRRKRSMGCWRNCSLTSFCKASPANRPRLLAALRSATSRSRTLSAISSICQGLMPAA